MRIAEQKEKCTLSFSVAPSEPRKPGQGNSPSQHEEIEAPLIPAGRFLPFILVTALFFLWGVPNNFNDILIRQFMKSFEINRLQAGLVQFAFYLGYFLLAMPAAQLMRRAGYKAGILVGLCLYGAGCLLFWPAAIVDKYWFFLTALFVIASGLAFLETAASPFTLQIGDPRSAARRLNFAQAFNPLGSISAVLIGSRFIFSGIELKPTQVAAMRLAGTYQAYLKSETLRVIAPYLVLGGVVLFWAVLIARTPFPHTGLDFSEDALASDHSKPLWKRRHFVFAVAAQFLYVGAQVGIWSYMIPYVISGTGIGERQAGYWLTGALVAFTAGRFFSAWLLNFIPAQHLLGELCGAQYGDLLRGRFAAGVVGCLFVSCRDLPDVDDVSIDFRVGHQGAGSAHQERRSLHCDGDHRGRADHAGNGARGRSCEHCRRLHCAGDLFCGYRTLRVAWIADGPGRDSGGKSLSDFAPWAL